MKTITQRYLALDVLRGMTVAGMILVNNPGTWSKIFPPLEHASWSGCTPTDLVFPFFLFIVGAALCFSFAKYNEQLNSASFKKLGKRALLIFLTGLALNAFPFYPTSPDPSLSFGDNYINYLNHIRIFGVLQRIALAYFVGGLLALWLRSEKKIIVALISVIFLHTLILALFGAPGSAFTLEGNITQKIDIALVGENHIYHGYGIPFDPEGLLGVISGSGTVLLGFLIGGIIRKKESKADAATTLFVTGMLLLAAGKIFSIYLPINKPMWTGSYVLYAGGWATMMLAFFIYFIDIKGKDKLFTPFRALGLNPLFAFVMAGVFAKTLGRIIKWPVVVLNDNGTFSEKSMSASSWFYNHVCVPLLGNNEFGSLLYALIYVAIFTGMAMYLYKKKIVIKL